jgi:hypothetical protein
MRKSALRDSLALALILLAVAHLAAFVAIEIVQTPGEP